MHYLSETVVYGNSLLMWVTFAAITLVAYACLRLVRGFAIRRLDRSVSRTETMLDDSLLELLRRYTHPFFLTMFSLFIGALVLDLPATVDTVLSRALFIAVLLQAALWANGAVNHFLQRAMNKRTGLDPESASAYSFLGLVSRIVLWSVFILAVLHNVGVDITTLIAGLGIAGVAVALGVQNILGDLFSSLSIMLDKPFVVGDFIAVDTIWGTVEHIGIKTTRVRSLSGEQIVFSNTDLLQARVHNFRGMTERRAVFNVGVTYDTPPDKLAAISDMIREIVESQEDVRFDRAYFQEFGEFALLFEVVFYVTTSDYAIFVERRQAINLEITRRFSENGIRFALPARRLQFEEAVPAAALARRSRDVRASGDARDSSDEQRSGERRGSGDELDSGDARSGDDAPGGASPAPS